MLTCNTSTTLKPVCGNGIIEQYEECDDTSGCCDSVTCKFKVQCSLNNGVCCDLGTCLWKPVSTSCIRDDGTQGVCVNGGCVNQPLCDNSANSIYGQFPQMYTNTQICPVLSGYTLGCAQRCTFSFNSNGCYSYTTSGDNHWFQDGTTCSRLDNSTGFCINGKCIPHYLTNFPFPFPFPFPKRNRTTTAIVTTEPLNLMTTSFEEQTITPQKQKIKVFYIVSCSIMILSVLMIFVSVKKIMKESEQHERLL